MVMGFVTPGNELSVLHTVLCNGTQTQQWPVVLGGTG